MTSTTSGSPFAPKGDASEWFMVYERIKRLEVGELVTYAELDELLGRDFRMNRSPMYRAQEEMQKELHRTTIAVNGKGYRIAHAREHEKIAKGHYLASRRQVTKAVNVSAAADRSQLTREEITRIDALELTMRTYGNMMKRLDTAESRREEWTEAQAAAAAAKPSTAAKGARKPVPAEPVPAAEPDKTAVAAATQADGLASLLRRHGIIGGGKQEPQE
jgi:hypothetical protein